MQERVYILDRIEGEEAARTAVFTADTPESPRTLFVSYARAASCASMPLREGDVCRLLFGTDGALVSVVPDPAARAAREADASARLHALFDRKNHKK